MAVPPSLAAMFSMCVKLTTGAAKSVIRKDGRVLKLRVLTAKTLPSYVNEKVKVPTTAPTVTVKGSATVPTHAELVLDVQPSVEHSTLPNRADGVVSLATKFRPTTETVLVVTDAATFVRLPRALTTGAVDRLC